MPTAYLDTSALVKRYLAERGTPAVDVLYHDAEAGRTTLSFSIWNVGEALSAIARTWREGTIDEAGAGEASWSLVNETVKLRGLGRVRVVPVHPDLLAACIPLLFEEGLTQPDALQIVTAREVEADRFVCADRRLGDAARSQGLDVVDPLDR